MRFHSIAQSNENRLFSNQNTIDSPFYYNEKVLAVYANHSYGISENKEINMGVRSESTFSDYTFKSSLHNKEFSGVKNYTNLLYNIGYYWNNEKMFQSVAYRKTISRPNYAYINPFRSISADITYSEGDREIRPSISHSLSYELLYNKFTFSYSSFYFKNFISMFFDEDDGNIVTTYKNFDKIWYNQIYAEYNENLFNRKWNLRPRVLVGYVKLWDDTYDIKPAFPQISLSVRNNFDLGKNYMATLFFSYNPMYKDGLLRHHSNHSSSVSLIKRYKQFQFTLYANDLLKGKRNKMSTLMDNYLYSSNAYSDVRNVGLSIRYTFVGKTYKEKQTETIEDDTLNRL